MDRHTESLHVKVQECLTLEPKSMCDDQEPTANDLSSPDFSNSGTDSKGNETSSIISRNNPQIRHEEKHGVTEKGRYEYVLEISEGQMETHRATGMAEDIQYEASERIKLAVNKVASGYQLLGKVRVAKFETRNEADDVNRSVLASELQEAAGRHEVACKEALAAARNVASLSIYCLSASCQDKQTRADVVERLNSLTFRLETAAQNLTATKETLQVALERYKLYKGKGGKIKDVNEVTFQVI
jgi:hypothetical protein